MPTFCLSVCRLSPSPSGYLPTRPSACLWPSIAFFVSGSFIFILRYNRLHRDILHAVLDLTLCQELHLFIRAGFTVTGMTILYGHHVNKHDLG